jgi:UDP-glucose 4-epimerase
MRIVVTGSTGAVGGMVVRELLKFGDEPIGYDLSDDFRFMGDVKDKFPFVRGDVLDWPRLQQTLQRYQPQAIIHTAYLLPDLAQANPYMAVQVNVVGTANMVELARLNGLRLVFTSTKGVIQDLTGEYGYPTYKPVNEDHPVIPPENSHTLYNDTKVFNEHYLYKVSRIYGLDYVILRFAAMYGPGRIRHGGRAIASEMVEAAFRGERYVLEEGGDERDDMLYLRDVARGCVLAAHAENLVHRTFIIATGQLVTLRDVAAEIKKHLPDARIEVGGGLDPFKIGFKGYGVFDISRARAELGYEPAYLLPEAVKDYLDTLRAIQPAG